MPGARLVITGEGSLDQQSLRGKVPVGVASAAADQAVPVVVAAGRSSLSDAQTRAAGIDAVYTLHALEPDLERCITDAPRLLELLAERVAADWLVGSLSPRSHVRLPIDLDQEVT